MVKMIKKYKKSFDRASMRAGVIMVTKRVKQLYEGDNTTEDLSRIRKKYILRVCSKIPLFSRF